MESRLRARRMKQIPKSSGPGLARILAHDPGAAVVPSHVLAAGDTGTSTGDTSTSTSVRKEANHGALTRSRAALLVVALPPLAGPAEVAHLSALLLRLSLKQSMPF